MASWLKILKHYKLNKYYQNGLTLPFLCGVQTLLTDNDNPLSISDFFNTINSEDFNEEITIMKCGNIGEYIFGILDIESREIYSSYSKNGIEIYTKYKNIFLIDNSPNHIQNDQELIFFFEKEYNEIIAHKQFSKINGEWNDYSEIDKKRITETKE